MAKTHKEHLKEQKDKDNKLKTWKEQLSQIKNLIKEERNENELAVFWDKMTSYLPKSIERSALGDEKIFIAFKETYPDIKKHIKISLIKMIVEMVESEKRTILDKIDAEDNKYWKANRNNDIGFNKALDTISSKLKELIKE